MNARPAELCGYLKFRIAPGDLNSVGQWGMIAIVPDVGGI